MTTKTVKQIGRQTAEPNIFDLLKQDHRKVEELFRHLLDEFEPDREIFTQIRQDLLAHMEGEERYFYPALKQGEDLTFLTNEAIVEHETARTLLNKIAKTSETSEMWLPHVKVLSQIVDMHIEEEESDVFKKAKKALSKTQQTEIAQRFQQGKTNSQRIAGEFATKPKTRKTSKRGKRS